MASLSDIREGLAANLAALDGVQVSAYMLASPQAPSGHIVPDFIAYDSAMGRGHDDWRLKIQVFVSLAGGDRAAQVRLDSFIASSGSQSVKALVESDKTLGGIAEDVRVVSCSGYQLFVFDGRPPLMGAEWLVDVLATGT